MILDSSDGCGIEVALEAPKADAFLASKILEIQWLQEQHDQHYHKDIYQLRPLDKLTHFSLHLGKYTGNLMELHQTDQPREFRRKAVDVLIICMSIANTLQVKLGEHTGMSLKKFEPNLSNLPECAYRYKLGPVSSTRHASNFDLVIDLMGHTAIMADSITEFNDGMLARSPRVEIGVAVIDAWFTGLAMYSNSQLAGEPCIPWTTAIMNRLIQVEKKNMFYEFMPKRATSFN